MLQLNSLKLGLWKFNIIINIINITFGSGVGVTNRPNTIKYSFTERPNIFKFKIFFDNFYI